ncbi:LLM class flavin-dependent oxidoreductase [Nocardia sp. NPDC101769]|uniref:LLM class flavin-dependent oxidoreductase n=1 Tax=Nocardia sp. NPDC101769 TaxID=3364333 RepID=UPI00380FC202
MTVRFPLEFALDTFGDRMGDEQHHPITHAQSIRNVVEQAELAEQVGVDVFGIGEHHTDEFPMPAGDVVLGTIAARTERIRLGSAVTVLSSDDPVRVFQRYSTLHALSNGRAEVILGRGSSTESFPLFGYDLADYDTLFEEKTNLFAALRDGGPITWQGTTRSALLGQDIVPHTETPLRSWIGVGGSPQSVIRAARYGFNLMLAIIGGHPARFAPFSQLYREALTKFDREQLPIGVHAPGHIAATDEEAFEEFYPRYEEVMRTVGRSRGFRVPTAEQLRRDIGPDGALYVGSPETVAHKIATNLRTLDATRFNLKFNVGATSRAQVLRAIDLYGTKVIPRVRELLTD